MSKKIILYIILIIIIAVAGYWIYRPKTQFVLDPKNCEYAVDGKNVKLTNGYNEQETTPDSASKIITRYFGNETTGDFNGDGLSDVAFLLTQELGGSGLFIM